MRRNAAGQVLEIEFLNDSQSFERIVNPYIENLKRLGIAAKGERVDSAQALEREKNFEFDIVTQRYVMSLTPGIELRGIFGSEAANTPGSNNIAGVANPAVDSLIEIIEGAKTREELNTAVHALDRVLRALHIWVPQWYKPVRTIAYFDMYERPFGDTPPDAGIGNMGIWWFNPERAEELRAAGAFQ
jgi:microcin C transport system substrate-binding protein